MKREDRETCHMTLVDREYEVYKCEACGELWQFEADGPFENNWAYCPHCGRHITEVYSPGQEEDD